MNNIATLSAKLILLATTTDEQEKEKLRKEVDDLTLFVEEEQSAFLKFTEKELSKMPKHFRKLFRTNGIVAHVRKRKRGNSISYEVRCRKSGYKISVSAKTLEKAKERFIKQLQYVDLIGTNNAVPTTFHSFSIFYFENYRKRKVVPETMKNDMQRYNKHIRPFFGEIPLRNITPSICQKLLDQILSEGKGKTADEVHCLLNGTFKYAISHNLLQFNPLATVYHEQHEQEHGVAISKEEERQLLSIEREHIRLNFAIILYTGLRPCEYKTIRREGNIIISVNAKGKKHKVRYKRIPINPMLAPYIGDLQEIVMISPRGLWTHLKKILPNHTLKDLRTTFHTRLQECNVERAARKAMMGHSDDKLSDIYTDLPNDYLIRESNKILYDLPPILPPI